MTRTFPNHTIEELKAAAKEGITDLRTQETVTKMKAEIEARENGASVHFSTPQVSWN